MQLKTEHRTQASDRPVFETFEDRTLFNTYTVTTNADSGTGSLRTAISAANSHAGGDTVNFKITTAGKTIGLLTTLPQITDAITIDATTQSGYTNKPLVQIDGAKSGGYGLVVRGGSSTVKGVSVTHFSTGILILNGGNNTIKGNYIGLDLNGNAAGNTDKGVIVQSPNNTIGGYGDYDRNVISGNKNSGIQLYTSAASGNKIWDNYLGTNASGTAAIGNGNGVAIQGGANNTVGGTSSAQRNVISGNGGDGIVVNNGGSTNNLIQGNYIGVDVTGAKKLGNGNYGVEISQPNNTVGGTSSGQRNVISGNSYSGVVLWLNSGSYNKVLGNYIGTDAAGKAAIGNLWRGLEVTNGSSNNVVGGAAGNLISGNAGNGVQQYLGSNNTFSNNVIGFNYNKTVAMGNGHDGITFIYASNSTATGNYIGNNAASAIARLGGSGITQSGNTIINDTLYGF